MKNLLIALFSINLLSLLYGFFLEKDEKQAQVIIGLSVMFFSFIIMPLFIYYRYKDKKKSDYIMTNLQDEKK